jgi:hypothetical protein
VVQKISTPKRKRNNTAKKKRRSAMDRRWDKKYRQHHNNLSIKHTKRIYRGNKRQSHTTRKKTCVPPYLPHSTPIILQKPPNLVGFL